MRTHTCNSTIGLLGLAGVMLVAVSAWADTTNYWTNTLGGAFENALNWSPNSVPDTTNDLAFFTNNAAYTVGFSSSPTNKRLHVKDGDVTFNIGSGNTYGFKYLVWDDTVGSGVGGSPTPNSGRARLTVTNGTLASDQIVIAYNDAAGSTSSLTMAGSAARLETRSIRLGGWSRTCSDFTLSDGAVLQWGIYETAWQWPSHTVWVEPGAAGYTNTFTVDNAQFLRDGGPYFFNLGRTAAGVCRLLINNGGLLQTGIDSEVGGTYFGRGGAVAVVDVTAIVDVTGSNSALKIYGRLEIGSSKGSIDNALNDGRQPGICIMTISDGGRLEDRCNSAAGSRDT